MIVASAKETVISAFRIKWENSKPYLLKEAPEDAGPKSSSGSSTSSLLTNPLIRPPLKDLNVQ